MEVRSLIYFVALSLGACAPVNAGASVPKYDPIENSRLFLPFDAWPAGPRSEGAQQTQSLGEFVAENLFYDSNSGSYCWPDPESGFAAAGLIPGQAFSDVAAGADVFCRTSEHLRLAQFEQALSDFVESSEGAALDQPLMEEFDLEQAALDPDQAKKDFRSEYTCIDSPEGPCNKGHTDARDFEYTQLSIVAAADAEQSEQIDYYASLENESTDGVSIITDEEQRANSSGTEFEARLGFVLRVVPIDTRDRDKQRSCEPASAFLRNSVVSVVQQQMQLLGQLLNSYQVCRKEILPAPEP